MAAPSVVRLRVLCVTSPKLRKLSIRHSKYGAPMKPFEKRKQNGGHDIEKLKKNFARYGALAGLICKASPSMYGGIEM